MDEEIQTIRHDKLKSYHALSTIAEAFPALGIVAAVLGVIKAMAAIDQPPEVLRRADRTLFLRRQLPVFHLHLTLDVPDLRSRNLAKHRSRTSPDSSCCESIRIVFGFARR